jgi:thioredoxin-dependent peroxiredoxin
MDTGIGAGGNRLIVENERELSIGDRAPEFDAEDADGRSWRLSELRGQRIVLYFYPKDDTPGCTTQARDLRDSQSRFDGAGYTVLGVSPQGRASHRAFAEKFGLGFPLLVDTDRTIAESYGATRASEGNRPPRVRRSTFVIDEEGRIAHALYDVAAKGHAATLTELLGI